MQFVQFYSIQHAVFPLEQNMCVLTKQLHLHTKYLSILYRLVMGFGWTVTITLWVIKGM